MKNMIICLVGLIAVFNTAYGEKLNVTVEPANPVINESFNLIFEIESTEKSDAEIFFDPSRAKILSKKYGNVSVNATVINGKVSVRRSMTHVYTLETDRPGLLIFKNIRAKLGRKVLKHSNVRVTVGRGERRRSQNIFLLAIPSKTSLYLGEGLNVRYYLYYRVPLVEQVTEFFPKLNGFFKRTPTNITSQEQTVEYQGRVYKRVMLYSYRLYPEKTGALKIDPFGVEVGYLHSRNRRGSFWRLGGGVKRTKKVRSKSVVVNVLPLPAENVPNNFLGLIGDHSFKITANKERFLVNEVVEVRLEVVGSGALEQLVAPKIYEHDQLESFDVKSSLVEISEEQAKKTFDYTFLTRGHLNIAPRDLKVHLFDPEKDQYFEKIISIPGISVLGGLVQKKEKANERVNDKVVEEKGPAVVNVEKRTLLAPVFNPGLIGLGFPWLDYLNMLLGALIILLPGYWLVKKYISGVKDEVHCLMGEFAKGKLEYAKLHRFLSLLGESEESVDIESLVRKSDLSQDAKKYFIGLLNSVAEKQYGRVGKKTQSYFNAAYFKEACRLISQRKQLV